MLERTSDHVRFVGHNAEWHPVVLLLAELMTEGQQDRKMRGIWNDRAVDVIPCRGECGAMIQRTAYAPKTAYCSVGCKERHTKFVHDARKVQSMVAFFAPIYEHCPRFAWYQILSMTKLIQLRHKKACLTKQTQ